MKKNFTKTILSILTGVMVMWAGCVPVSAQCNIYLDSLVTPTGDTMVFCSGTCPMGVTVYAPALAATSMRFQISNQPNVDGIDSVVIITNKTVYFTSTETTPKRVVVRFVSFLPTFAISDTMLCPKTPVTFNAGINAYASYLWSTGETTQSITASDTGVYSVDITNACGTQSDTANITNHLVAPINLGGDQAICDSIGLATNANVVSYLWSTGETTQAIIAKASGFYALQTVDSNGCQAKDTVVLTTTTPYDYGSIDLVGHDTTSNTCNVLSFSPSIPAKVEWINIYRKVGNAFIMQGNLPTGYYSGGFQDCGIDNSAFSAEYRITTSDSCGHEGLPGPIIQTCLVQKSFYQNTLSVFWNAYTINNRDTVTYYNLVGIDSQGIHTVIYPGMSNSLLTCNVPNPDPNIIYHYISYGLPPAGSWKTMGATEGRSNYSKDLLTGQREFEAYKAAQVKIYSYNGQVRIETSQTIQKIEVSNILGQKIFTTTEREFSLSPSGVLFVRVVAPSGVTTKKILN